MSGENCGWIDYVRWRRWQLWGLLVLFRIVLVKWFLRQSENEGDQDIASNIAGEPGPIFFLAERGVRVIRSSKAGKGGFSVDRAMK
jgi:hypothetical protein